MGIGRRNLRRRSVDLNTISTSRKCHFYFIFPLKMQKIKKKHLSVNKKDHYYHSFSVYITNRYLELSQWIWSVEYFVFKRKTSVSHIQFTIRGLILPHLLILSSSLLYDWQNQTLSCSHWSQWKFHHWFASEQECALNQLALCKLNLIKQTTYVINSTQRILVHWARSSAG